MLWIILSNYKVNQDYLELKDIVFVGSLQVAHRIFKQETESAKHMVMVVGGMKLRVNSVNSQKSPAGRYSMSTPGHGLLRLSEVRERLHACVQDWVSSSQGILDRTQKSAPNGTSVDSPWIPR